jgi:TRAP-type C4-dicarboxylate transport system permease small subunit
MELTKTNNFVKFRNSVVKVSRWFEWVGLTAMMVIVLAALIDVIGSKAFSWPLPGSTEIASMVQVIAISAGMAFSKIDGRHIIVDFLIAKFPRRLQAGLEIFSNILGLGLWIILGLMILQYGQGVMKSGTTTFLLKLPIYPFAYWAALCCIPMCLAIILELFSAIDKELKR